MTTATVLSHARILACNIATYCLTLPLYSKGCGLQNYTYVGPTFPQSFSYFEPNGAGFHLGGGGICHPLEVGLAIHV